MAKVKADTDLCAGLGMCESWAPAIFKVGDDAKVHILESDFDEPQRAAVQGAVDNCPMGALSIE